LETEKAEAQSTQNAAIRSGSGIGKPGADTAIAGARMGLILYRTKLSAALSIWKLND
jgi:hypothetical protein